MKNILGYDKKKILLVNYQLEPRKEKGKQKYIHCNNNNLRFWFTCSAGVFRNLAVLASFISMDLTYENLTFHGILFLTFSILNPSHPVINTLEIVSFLEVLKLHFITFFLLSYINQGRPFVQLSCLENARSTDLSLWFEPTRAWTYDGPHWRRSC